MIMPKAFFWTATAARSLVAAAVALGMWTSAASAQDNLKVGIIATLSGPPAVIGQQMRNGFELAVKDLGGKLGGRDTEILVADDELKPDVAVTKVKAMIDRDKVDFIVGTGILEHSWRHREAGDRGQRVSHQPECRIVQLRRQGLQP